MIFHKENNTDGKFGMGKVPFTIQTKLENMEKSFLNMIPEKKKDDMTFHIWFQDMHPHLQSVIQEIAQDAFWTDLMGEQGQMENIQEMDELYYSKTPLLEQRGILYGATGNYDLHKDGIFRFPHVEFYRVLIGLTDGNKKVETVFPILQESIYINKNDYIVFDFDKASHQVLNYSKDNNQHRVILKLHFCVFTKKVHPCYRNFVCQCYILYEKITRYFMQTGTNPSTYYQFLIGLICYSTVKAPYLLYTFVLLLFYYLFRRCSKLVHVQKIGQVLLFFLLLFLLIVFFFWARYQLLHIR